MPVSGRDRHDTGQEGAAVPATPWCSIRRNNGDEMIDGIHFMHYSENPAADLAFFRDVIGLPGVQTHEGRLIFALPPAELGVHPMETDWPHSLFLMCQDLDATIAELETKGTRFTEPRWEDPNVGRFATLQLPGGATLGVYQPAHPTPLPGWPTSRPPETASG
jgi:predicted enzyme related to lactoylglutathione lyase